MTSVRLLTIADLAAYRALHRAALIEAPNAFVENVAQDEARSDAVVAEMLARGEAWGAFEGERLVGKLVLDGLPHVALAHTKWLHAVYVDPEGRGSGVAAALVRVAIAAARAAGASRFALWVNSENARARRFYESFGFRETGRIPEGIAIDGRLMDDVLMCLDS